MKGVRTFGGSVRCWLVASGFLFALLHPWFVGRDFGKSHPGNHPSEFSFPANLRAESEPVNAIRPCLIPLPFVAEGPEAISTKQTNS